MANKESEQVEEQQEDLEVDNPNGENEEKPKNKRKRRVINFPTSTYEDSLEIANAIWKFASGQKIRRLTLFDNIGRSPDSSLSRSIITTSAKYKLTTGSYSAEFLELTEDGALATNPDGDITKKIEANFKLAILSNEYFAKLYENYKDMRLPITSVMSDYLAENGLNRDECDQCVEIFVLNCKYLGIIQPLAGSERIVTLEYLIENVSKETKSPKSSSAFGCTHAKYESVNQPEEINPTEDKWERICFFIAPIGDDDSEERKHSDLFLGQFVEPVLNQFGLKVIRADQIDTAGMITSQIIEHIVKSKIVVADLSFHNPNVFYELSLRHAQNKPTIHLIRKCDKIPFDITSFRTITIDDSSIYTLLPQLESYKTQLSSQVRKILDEPGEIENPISAYFQSAKNKGVK